MNQVKKISYEEWFNNYEPILDDDGCIKDFSDLLSDTPISTSYIWTRVSCDNENEYILSGLHLVNRIGYYYTDIPHSGEDIEVNCNTMINAETLNSILDELRSKRDEIEIFNHLENLTAEALFPRRQTYSIGDAKYEIIFYLEDRTQDDLVDYVFDEIFSVFEEQEFELF